MKELLNSEVQRVMAGGLSGTVGGGERDSEGEAAMQRVITRLEELAKAKGQQGNEDRARVLADPSELFTDEFVAGLINLEASNKVMFWKVKNLAKDIGFDKSLLQQLVDDNKRTLRQMLRDAREDPVRSKGEPRKVKEYIEDVPRCPDHYIPAGYEIDEEGTYKVIFVDGERRLQRIAHQPIIVSGYLREVSTGRVRLHITWKTDDGYWDSDAVEMRQAKTVHGIAHMISEGFPANSVNALDIIQYLEEAQAINRKRGTLAIARTAVQMGWQGKGWTDGFVIGRAFITPDGEVVDGLDLKRTPVENWVPGLVFYKGLEGTETLLDAFNERGTLQEWTEALILGAPYSRLRLQLYANLVPPLFKPLGIRTFGGDWSNTTSTGKSTGMIYGGSVLGRPEIGNATSPIKSWGGSIPAIERLAAAICDLPLNLDDTKNAIKRNPDIVSRIIYLLGQGETQARATPNGLQPSYPIRTVLLTNGEAPAISYSTNDPGAKTRILTIRGVPFAEDNSNGAELSAEITERFREVYGVVYKRWIAWITRQLKTRREKWLESLKERRAKYAGGSRIGAVNRLAGHAAIIDLTAELFHEFMKEQGAPMPWPYTDPVAPLWNNILREVADVDSAKDALERVYAWCVANRNSFWRLGSGPSPRDQLLGRWDDESSYAFIGIMQEPLEKFIRDCGIADNPIQIYTAWEQRGWIERGKETWGKQNKLGDDRPRMITIKREAIEAMNEVENEDEERNTASVADQPPPWATEDTREGLAAN
jgi:hypothetical protein